MKKKNAGRARHPKTSAGADSAPLISLAAGFLLASDSFLAVPAYRVLFPFLAAPSGWMAIVMGALGWVLMAAGFRMLPPPRPVPELGRQPAWIGLAVILVLAYVMRLSRLDVPLTYCGDHLAEGLYSTRNYLELKGYLRLYTGYMESPIFHAWSAGLWALLPGVKGLFIQRVAGSILDLVAVWLMYLLGREIGGRRVGLALAFLGAFSKPMVRESLRGLEVTTVPVMMAWALLAVARLVKKPDLRRFLQWGASLTALFYAYTACRPLVPFLVLAVWLWLMWNRKDGRGGPLPWVLSFLVLVLFLWMFGARSEILPIPAAAARVLGMPGALWPLAAAFLFLFQYLWRSTRKGSAGRTALYWVLAVSAAWVLMTPGILNPKFGDRISRQFHSGMGDITGVGAVLERVRMVVGSLFLGWELEFGDSILNFHMAGLSLFALAWFAARPSGKGAWYLALALFGLSGEFILGQPQEVRVLPAIVPWLALAALSWGWGLGSVRRLRRGRVLAVLWVLTSVLWASWAAKTNHDQLYGVFQGAENPHWLTARIIQSNAPRDRVYLLQQSQATNCSIQSILCEGYPFYQWGETNRLCVRKGQMPPDVLVLLNPEDRRTARRILERYPGARLEELRTRDQEPSEPAALLSVRVPSSQLGPDPGGMLDLERVSKDAWIRRFTVSPYGMRGGFYRGEDAIPDLSGPPPEADVLSVRYEGAWTAPQTGEYRFSSRTANYVLVFVGGRKVLDLRPAGPERQASSRVRVEAGRHPVEILVYRRAEAENPRIEVTGPGGEKGFLGMKSDKAVPGTSGH